MNRPLVSIIVATINTPRLTEACLNAVIKNTAVPYELIVVNNTRSKVMKKILKSFGAGVRVIQNSKNLGYTKAANQGALISLGEYLCFLNSDTLVPQRWLERLLEGLQQKPGIGAVGPMTDGEGFTYFLPKDRFTAQQMTELVDEVFQRKPVLIKSVPFLTGFCWVIPRVVMATVGLFDERFFFGWEDFDYALRLRLQGFSLGQVNSLFVHHLLHGSSSPSQYQRLIRGTFKRLLAKWRSILNLSSVDFHEIEKTVNRKVKSRVKASQAYKASYFRRTNLSFKAPRLLRRGIAVRTEDGQWFKGLARLSDLEVWVPDRLSREIWELLEGSLSLKEVILLRTDHSNHSGKISKKKMLRRVEELERYELITKIFPPKKTDTLVTVMMAAYNAERWIGEAIDSIASQTFNRFELIIVDDGSTDRTASIAQRYLWHPQVRFFKNPRRLGIAATRNRILNLARGEYLAVCDADDVMLPTLLKRFFDFLDSHRNVAWVYANRLKIGLGGFLGVDFAIPMDGKKEFKQNIIAHAGAMIRKSAIFEAGGYDETLLATEDYDLALKIAERSNIRALPGETHYLWRRHENSASTINPWAKQETERLLRQAHIRRAMLNK